MTNYLYDDIVPSQDEGEIYNRVTVTRTGGTAQVAQDLTSQSAYFLRDYTQSDLKILTDGDALARAQFLLIRFKDPEQRFASMVVDPRADDAFAAALNLELGDMITVERFTDSPINQNVFVDGIDMDIDRDNKQWIFTFALSPEISDVTQDWWIAGTSALGTDTRLAF